jgi:DNA modification methylase
MTVRIITGDCREVLATLPAESVHCVVTSPPYWGLRDYGVPSSIWGGDDDCAHEWGEEVRTAWANSVPGPAAREGGANPGKNGDGRRNEAKWTGPFCQRCGAWRGAHGLEPDFGLFVENQVRIFREVRRALRADGTLWLNLGDCYATGAGKVGNCPGGGVQGEAWKRKGPAQVPDGKNPNAGVPTYQPNRMPQPGLKSKDLVGVPWRVAFALQADGWWLRQDIIWSKPNPMPESVTDRCTKAHEYLFLLSKSERYYYDADAIAEPAAVPEGAGNVSGSRYIAAAKTDVRMRTKAGLAEIGPRDTRNKRSVWTVTTRPFSEAHFATFPPALIEPCILAGCPKGGTVLDCFGGAGTTGLVAERLQRDAVLIELNPDYADMAARRIAGDAPLLNAGGVAMDNGARNKSANISQSDQASPPANPLSEP